MSGIEIKAEDMQGIIDNPTPVQAAFFRGVSDGSDLMDKWEQDQPACHMLDETCPFNALTQEALVYAWHSGALLSCANHIEQLLMN